MSDSRRRQPEGEKQAASGEGRKRANVESREASLLVEGVGRRLRAWEGEE